LLTTKIEPLTANGFRLSNVFPLDMLDYVSKQCDTFTNGHFRINGNGRREYSTFNIDQTPEIKKHLYNLIFQITNKPFKHSSTELWRDYPGYTNDIHVDADNLENVMIIYLGDGDCDMGTRWFESASEYHVPYTNNTGIVLLNSNKILHGMIGKVQGVDYRKSIYLNWKTL